MKLTIPGSGSPEAYARRASAGHLLEVAGRNLLFDCGGGVFDRLPRAGFGPSDIDALFLPHLHSDHMMDYARFAHARWDEGGLPLQVFGPAPIAAITEKLFGPDGVFAHDLTARCELPGSREIWVARGGLLPRPWPAPETTEIGPGFAFEGDGWRLTSCEARHVQPHLICMGYRVDADQRAFPYSGDAGSRRIWNDSFPARICCSTGATGHPIGRMSPNSCAPPRPRRRTLLEWRGGPG